MNYSGGGIVFCTNSEQIFKHMAIDPNTQLTMMQQRETRAIKNARLLPDSCRFHNDTGNELLFRINISQPLMIAGLEGVDLWLGLPGHWTSHQWTSSYEATLKPWFTHHQLMLKRILLPVLLRQQQPDIFECSHQSLLHRQLCNDFSGHPFEHLL